MNLKTYSLSGALVLLAILLTFFAGMNIPTGLFVFEEIAPEGFEFELPGEATEQIASSAIEQAQQEIAEMRQRNFTTTFVNDVLNEANLQYEQGNYTATLKMTQLISFIRKEKIKFLDQIELAKLKDEEFQEKEVDTSEGKALVGLAMEAFTQDQLVDAQELLQQADIELEKAKAEKERQNGLAYLSKNFILKYWWQILLVIIVIAVGSPPTTNKIIKKKRQQKLTGLKTELEKTNELIKRMQKVCFVDKKMTAQSYKDKVKRYEERIAEIKHTIPVIEAQLKGKKALPQKEKPIGIIEVKK